MSFAEMRKTVLLICHVATELLFCAHRVSYLFVPTLPFARVLLVVNVFSKPLRDLPRNNGRFVNDAATKSISKFMIPAPRG